VGALMCGQCSVVLSVQSKTSVAYAGHVMLSRPMFYQASVTLYAHPPPKPCYCACACACHICVHH
jgi:hypothetical protein